jgi:biopolymer transport protein ExbD
MLKWLLDGPRLVAVAIIFATLVAAEAQAQSDKPIILNIRSDLSLILGDTIVTRDGLVAALQAATNGDRNERIYVRAHKGVSYGDLMVVMNTLRLAGYVKIAMVLEPDQTVTSANQQTVVQTQLAAMRAKIMAHWNPSPAIVSRPDNDQYVVVVRIQLDRDGRLSAPPQVISKVSGPLYQVAAEAAKRAILLSQPFDMLSPSTYDAWKDVEINFDPRAVGTAPSH